jgi:hypothetical protein
MTSEAIAAAELASLRALLAEDAPITTARG